MHLYGYEALGLEFARLLVGLRPDLTSILEDEEVHVGFSNVKSAPYSIMEDLPLMARGRLRRLGGDGCRVRSAAIFTM